MSAITPAQISFRQILIATDLSDASTNALNYAKVIAKQYASHILLVHVGQPVRHIAIPQGGWVEDQSTQRVEEETYALGAKLRGEGYEAKAITRYGQIEHEILALAKSDDADLIVVGTHGRRGMERLLFGSEAEALICHVDRPVLTVGPAAAPPRANTWLLNEIICAAVPGTHSAKAAAYGYRLAQENGAGFALFYAEDPGSSPGPGSWRAFEDAFDKELPGGKAQQCPIQGYFSNESPASDIVEVAKRRQADLIVLGAKHAIPGSTHFRQGVLPEVLLRAPCPVLTISSH
jgi:nucleotide-binding universal stress UspA family protein